MRRPVRLLPVAESRLCVEQALAQWHERGTRSSSGIACQLVQPGCTLLAGLVQALEKRVPALLLLAPA